MNVNQSTLLLAPLLLGLALTAGPAAAHHSGAMFDRTHTITIDGAFLSQEYTNPHVWISVMGKPLNSKLKVARWDIETVSTGNLIKMGITKETLKPGDKLKVKINPLRDGRHGGSLQTIITADGVEHGFHEGDAGGVAPE